jgi:hypothetical protein
LKNTFGDDGSSDTLLQADVVITGTIVLAGACLKYKRLIRRPRGSKSDVVGLHNFHHLSPHKSHR